MQEKHYQEYFHSISSSNGNKNTNSGVPLNPEANANLSVNALNHLNPILQNKKPFLTQVKQRAINPDQYKNSKPQKIEEDNKAQKTSDQQIRGINAHRKDYIPVAHKLREEMQSNSRQSSKQKSGTLISTVGNQDQFTKFLKDENKFLRDKSEKINEDLKKQLQKTFQKDKQLRQKNRIIEELKNTIKQYEANYNKLLQEYNSHQNNDKNQSFSELNQKYLQLLEHCSQLQIILKQKDEYMHSAIQNKTNQYTSSINFKNSSIKALQQRIDILQKQNNTLVTQMSSSVSNLNNRKQEIDVNQFQLISRDFQDSINQYIKENSKLKNIIGQQEGKIEELKMKNESLSTLITAFQQRQEMNKDTKLIDQVNFLRQQLQKEQQEYDSQLSRKQLEILKLQNEIDTKKYEERGSLLDFTDQQKLHQKFMSMIKENEILQLKINAQMK